MSLELLPLDTHDPVYRLARWLTAAAIGLGVLAGLTLLPQKARSAPAPQKSPISADWSPYCNNRVGLVFRIRADRRGRHATGRVVAVGSHYRVMELLGEGWEGEVYKVVETVMRIERAAKRYYPRRNPHARA